jgi:hypothetical protein
VNRAEAAAVVRGIGEFLAAHADEIGASIAAGHAGGPAGHHEPPELPYMPVAGHRVRVSGAVMHRTEPFLVEGEVVDASGAGDVYGFRVLRDHTDATYEFSYALRARRWASADPSVVSIDVTRLE